MARKTVAKGPRARALAASSRPTPVSLSQPTPVSAADPSTNASEVEHDLDEDISKQLDGLTVSGTAPTTAPAAADEEKKKRGVKKPFRFMDLPGELRAVIYGFHFADVPRVIDLEPGNHRRIQRTLCIVRTCRTLYNEAAYFFYSTRTFRMFPIYPGRYFKTKKPLLARLNARQRSWITSLELRVGPGWGNPPKGWVVNPALGLADCVNVRNLIMYVEVDPSDAFYNGFRRADGFFEGFCQTLLSNTIAGLHNVDTVVFDAYTGVKKSGAMMRGLLDLATTSGMLIRWGPDRGWTDHDEEEAVVDTTVVDDASLGLLDGVPMGLLVVA